MTPVAGKQKLPGASRGAFFASCAENRDKKIISYVQNFFQKILDRFFALWHIDIKLD